MKIKLTVLAFFISMLLTGQVLAFDVGGLSYSVINATDVEVKGRASGNTATDIVIPDTVEDSGTTYSVTTIGGEAFYENELTSVIIPDSVTTIESYAFYRNELTSVIIPDSVTTIEAQAFYDNALTSVIIPGSVTTIENSAFYGNALTSVIIPDSVTTIENSAFYGNALTSAAFEGDFGAFMLDMFDDNPTLATITYCNGTAGWPQDFNNGSTNVVTTPIKCLSNIDGLSYSVINATDVAVTGRASGNTATVIVIPDTVVFSGTTYSVTTIGYRAFFNNALTSVIIPDSVTTIGNLAFYNNALTSVIIPGSVTTIGDFSFSINALTSVIIPDSVTTIGDNAFIFNNALTSAAFEGDFLSFSLTIFQNNPALATITYCDGTTGWPQGFNTGSTTVVTAPIGCLPPDAPTIDSIVAGDGQAVITVTPGADNGSPITGYTAYCFGDTFNLDASPASPITVSGLTNGVSYACAVTAANDGGTSPPSAVSAPFTPVGPPPGC